MNQINEGLGSFSETVIPTDASSQCHFDELSEEKSEPNFIRLARFARNDRVGMGRNDRDCFGINNIFYQYIIKNTPLPSDKSE
ncbi:MAG: hypothetical protein BWK80_47805 [Desulfobacteraceae bacterium IS3]|nr:MAG: hypothetical protein BWK80_47805 [Desulfobacteraceae bacterium IS3]